MCTSITLFYSTVKQSRKKVFNKQLNSYHILTHIYLITQEKKDDRNTLPLSETSIQQTRVTDKSAKTKAKHSRADLKERPQSTKHQSVPAREISKANDRGGKSDSEKSIHKSSRGDLVEDSPDDHHHVNDKDTNVDRQELGEEIKPSRHKPRGINRYVILKVIALYT